MILFSFPWTLKTVLYLTGLSLTSISFTLIERTETWMIRERGDLSGTPPPHSGGPIEKGYSGVVLLVFKCASVSLRDLVEVQIDSVGLRCI